MPTPDPIEAVLAAIAADDWPEAERLGATLDPPWVLGRFAVDVLARVRGDDELVVMAWPDELDGRKFHSEGALYANGKPVAVASATWVQLRETPSDG